MNFDFTVTDDHGLLKLHGDMNIYEAATLKASELFTGLNKCSQLDVDLSQVEELDSAGLQIMIAAKKNAQVQGKVLNFIDCSAAVSNILSLCNMTAYFAEATVSEAV